MMLKLGGILVLFSGLVSANVVTTSRYPQHPHQHLEDYFHELQSTEDANRIIDEIVKYAYLQYKDFTIDLPELNDHDVSHLPGAKITIGNGIMRGIKKAERKGDSTFSKEGDDITVRGVIQFPSLNQRYNKVEVRKEDALMTSTLYNSYNSLQVEIAVTHHEKEHTNTLSTFKLLPDYSGSSIEFLRSNKIGALKELNITKLMQDVAESLWEATESALRRMAREHIVQ